MSQDIILVTIDCWRYDAVQRMSNLLLLTDNYVRTEAICQSAATNGVFPAILSSMYHPYAYKGCVYPTLKCSGRLKSHIRPLPQVLSEHGYSTGAIVASNPWLNKWAEYFDYFWNDGLSGVSTDVTHFRSSFFRKIRGLHRFILLKDWVTASEVTKRAKDWYVRQKQPRFLWMHLMEPHSPFFPGLKKGLAEGLLKPYRANLQFARSPDNCSEEVLRATQNLYWKSVDKLDEQIPEVLEFFNEDATVLIMADHGQEFFHGVHRHARLYDECVRVPLLIKWTLPDSLELPRKALRQIDLAPTVLRGLDLPIPDNWQGRAIQEKAFLPSPMVNYAPQLERTYIGIRTEGRKFIRTFDSTTGEEMGRELYNLEEDSEEKNNIYNKADAEDLAKYLEEFLQPLKFSSGERERLRRLWERLRKQGM